MDPINRRVAERLRVLRKAAGLSLDDLASRSGVSRAALSQIETLKTNPTIAVLWKIASGLDVPFSELLGDAEAPTVRIERAAKARWLGGGRDPFRSRPLLGRIPGHRVEIYELTLAAGKSHDAQPHPAGSFEQVFVEEGRLVLGVDGGVHALGPGDAILFRADRAHRYVAEGRKAFRGLSTILYGE